MSPDCWVSPRPAPICATSWPGEAPITRADEAIDLFCYTVKKWVGAYAATLGGLDTLIFSGGIGENAPEVRRAVCAGLEFLGIRLDSERNQAGAPLISTDSSPAAVRVIPTDEEAMIAREVARITQQSPRNAQ